MSEQRLRKAVSDISNEIFKYETLKLEAISSSDSEILEVKQAECECCGLKEDCTQDYISIVKGSHSGYWVCGLCSEAVKETLEQGPKMATQEAVSSHKDFCQKFNTTTRLNPKLSLTCAMRDIAKRSSEKRHFKNSSISKLARSTSCVPRIDLQQ
ncbi:hypothetical protein P3X46_034618 [Hevea brasiliensis]|uniref:DUF1677 family protein n=1 Tax=Hevea brasiliensis TaxID=3981 RepID=A0ABQ9K963_HEVBR|nr:uncharacterized protein LOC131177355 [Hevea brasiliensis]KAJ9128680.1 hypothetical protein P3X46_034618 [Hevea brasiliensis]